ncbi:MAG: discoidin domain-containing protein, partial [Phycisphaeraceae bacterium]|nr:discoidin domain-containing protein [Phycisphaeraceae bacterium]
AITATASSWANEFSPPSRTIDSSGLDGDVHSTSPEDMWFSATVDLAPWLQYEFETVKQLDSIKVWNSNGAAEMALGWGVKDVLIEYSVDGENWDVLADASQFSRAPGAATYATYDDIAFGGVPAKFVRLGIQNNWGGILMSYSLSEIQFMEVPAAARQPVPGDGTGDVVPNATVAWRAGREAGAHTVYVSTDPNAVANGSAPSVSSSTNSLDLGEFALALEETYYWRVDEVNDAEATPLWEGSVWSFTTSTAVVVDDFESYGNSSPDRPFQTWLDGFGYSTDEFFTVGYGGNGTGAGIGHDIWSLSSPYFDGDIMEADSTMAGSKKSMPFYYGNTGGVASETQQIFAVPQDWTVGNAKILSVAFRGTAGNTGSLYVKINDTKVLYAGSSINTERPAWTVWSIDLAATGANLSSVTKMAIGMDGSGASGMLLIDDILLHPETFVATASSDITTPGDAVQGVPNDDDWPAAESPDLAFDDDTATKYLHRKGGSMATGFQITPIVGSTVVTGITLTTANDVANRDPITFELSGSNASIDGPYELIAAGDVIDFAGEAAWPRFTQNETAIEFENAVGYTHYQIVFPTLRGASEALMQISEVELSGAIQ